MANKLAKTDQTDAVLVEQEEQEQQAKCDLGQHTVEQAGKARMRKQSQKAQKEEKDEGLLLATREKEPKSLNCSKHSCWSAIPMNQNEGEGKLKAQW